MTDPFSPIRVGPITIPNRFIRSGANEMMTHRMLPTQSMLRFHERLAAGGVGMTTMAYVSVSRDGRTFNHQGVIGPESIDSYRAVTDAIHAHGSLASAQITHAGHFVQHGELSTKRAMSSSGGIDKMGAMNDSDRDMVKEEFVEASRNAVKAGFDAVELHMGHGYLLNQYISPLSNKRKDKHGGNAENRVRWPAEVLAAVKAAVGDRIAVLAKINLYDGAKGGATVADAVVTAKALEVAGADMLVLSGGRNLEASWVMFHSPLPYDDLARIQPGFFAKLQFKLLKLTTPKEAKFRQNYFMDAAKQVRAAVRCQLGYLGGVHTLENVNEALGEGFEAVVMARALVHDPEIVAKWRVNADHRSGCSACNRCVAIMYGPSGTHCVLTDTEIPFEYNRIPAGENLHAT